MGRIWESRFRGGEKSLLFSGLPGECAALAGERLRPLGHVSADPFRGTGTEKQGEKRQFLIANKTCRKLNMFPGVAIKFPAARQRFVNGHRTGLKHPTAIEEFRCPPSQAEIPTQA